jgi:hypothetical protein
MFFFKAKSNAPVASIFITSERVVVAGNIRNRQHLVMAADKAFER